MHRYLKVVCVVFFSCFLVQHFQAFAGAETKGDVAAKVGDKIITFSELDDSAKSALIPLQAEIYQARKQSLDQMVAEILFELEAKSLNTTAAEYKKGLLNKDAIAVSEDDILKYYQDNSYYFQNKPLEGMKAPIRERIILDRLKEKERQVITSLKVKYPVETYLNEPEFKIDTAGAPSRGPEGAKITLIEFSDFQCPYCGRFKSTVDRIVSEYPNDIRHVFRHNPLPMHSHAMKAHHAAVCAHRLGKFWEYRNVLFDHQNALGPSELRSYAESVGMNLAEYDACMADASIDGKLEDDVEYARSVGADGTPTSFLNGRMLSGARPYEEVKAIVDEALHS
ncbi:MAG: thioredoxin domain-containing protein [Candidatus Omnitrophica bacterium]|nr:thioredoxin domain-containing protein [Candidatus Omnitrophota bacterium]